MSHSGSTFPGVNILDESLGGHMGQATLAGGTVTVNHPCSLPDACITAFAQDGNTVGALRIDSRVSGVSFTVKSSDATDSGVIIWEIKHLIT